MPLSWIVLLVALWTAVIGLSMLVLGLNSRMTDLERRLPHTHTSYRQHSRAGRHQAHHRHASRATSCLPACPSVRPAGSCFS